MNKANQHGNANLWGEYTSKPSWAIVWRGRPLIWFSSAAAASTNCIAYRREGWDGAYVEFDYNQTNLK